MEGQADWGQEVRRPLVVGRLVVRRLVLVWVLALVLVLARLALVLARLVRQLELATASSHSQLMRAAQELLRQHLPPPPSPLLLQPEGRHDAPATSAAKMTQVARVPAQRRAASPLLPHQPPQPPSPAAAPVPPPVPPPPRTRRAAERTSQ